MSGSNEVGEDVKPQLESEMKIIREAVVLNTTSHLQHEATRSSNNNPNAQYIRENRLPMLEEIRGTSASHYVTVPTLEKFSSNISTPNDQLNSENSPNDTPIIKLTPQSNISIPNINKNQLISNSSNTRNTFKVQLTSTSNPKVSLKNSYPGIKLVCDKCPKTFDSYSILQLHKKIHNSMDNSEKICKKDKNSHHITYNCELCSFKTKDKSKLQIHITEECIYSDFGNKFECIVCYKIYTSSSVLRNHVMSCHEDQWFTCQGCKYRTKWVWHFDLHISYCLKLMQKCKKCNKTFQSVKELNEHCKSVHPPIACITDGENFKLKCPSCPELFKNYLSLSMHQRKYHVAGKKPLLFS